MPSSFCLGKCHRTLNIGHPHARCQASYPALQLRGELSLELARGPITVVPLHKDLGGQGRAAPQLLQAVYLGGGSGVSWGDSVWGWWGKKVPTCPIVGLWKVVPFPQTLAWPFVHSGTRPDGGTGMVLGPQQDDAGRRRGARNCCCGAAAAVQQEGLGWHNPGTLRGAGTHSSLHVLDQSRDGEEEEGDKGRESDPSYRSPTRTSPSRTPHPNPNRTPLQPHRRHRRRTRTLL